MYKLNYTPPEKGDAELFYKWYQDVDDWYNYFGDSYNPQSLTAYENADANFGGDPYEHEFRMRTKDTNQLIGKCGYNSLNIVNGRATLFCYIAPEFRGKGYGKDSLAFRCWHGFNVFRLNRLEANVVVFNIASRKNLESFGFTLEGIARQKSFVNGKFVDQCRYALLKEDYEKNIS